MKENQTYYFMAGLPRAGSTILSAILNQNPRFYSGPSSPVTGLMLTLEQSLSSDELFLAYPKVEQGKDMIANVIKHYYSDVEKPVIFDKNRSWVNRLHYIPGYFGIEAKVLCPVRNIDEILTSFISMHRRNPYQVNGRINFMDDMLVKSNIPLTDDNRCQFLAGPNGILGQSYNGIKQCLMEGRQKQLHFVEYDELMTKPEETMRKVYEFLGEEYYNHDFSNLINFHQENDASVYGLSDMHDVRKELGKTSADPRDILSPYILENCKGAEFWRELNNIDGSMIGEEGIKEQINTTVNESDTKLIG